MGSIPAVEISLMGGTGGCMLGGSEDDLCRPTRSKEPGFQLPEAEDWPMPPRPESWTEELRQRRFMKMRRKKKAEPASTLKVWSFPCERN